MTPAEAYKILEISPKASHEEVVSKYRRLAFIFHPDKNEDKAAAHENFIRLKDAYDLIMLIRQKGVDEFADFFAKKAEETAAEAKAKQERKEAGKKKQEAREDEFEKNREAWDEKFEKYETQAQKLKKEKRRAKAAERKARSLPKKGEKTE